jgi:starvation-inducible DNA-binding protein
MAMSDGYSVPGMSPATAATVRERLQQRLVALIDLELTLKHVHWNVVGPTFIGVHEMLDPQVAAVRTMVDTVAERIATLGGSPVGTPGFVAANRTWQDYGLGRATTLEHLGALDVVYDGVVADHRAAIDEFDPLDRVTQDVLIEQSAELEQFQWFVRAHLEDPGGSLATAGATSLEDAASRAATRRDEGPTTKRAGRARKAASRKR